MQVRKAVLTGMVFLGLAAVAGRAAPVEYEIDPVHSEIVFRVKYMGLSTVSGRFDKFSGGFTLDTANVPATGGSATIEAASINTSNQKRDDHLRSEDFFHVEKHPRIKFMSKGVKPKGNGVYELAGDLTMRGMTKPVKLEVRPGGLGKDPWGNQRAAFSAKGTLNRKEWGLEWNKALEAGGLLVGEDVELELSFQGLQKKAEAAKASTKAKPAGKTAKEKKSGK